MKINAGLTALIVLLSCFNSIGQAPFRIEMFRTDEITGSEEMLPTGGGVIAGKDLCNLRLLRNPEVELTKGVYFTLFDFRPDGEIHQLTGKEGVVNSNPLICYLEPNGMSMSLPLKFSFEPPYGIEEFVVIFSESPLSFEDPSNQSRGSSGIDLQTVKEIKEGNIPEELKGKISSYSFSFVIRSETMIPEDLGNTTNLIGIQKGVPGKVNNVLDRSLVPNEKAYVSFPVLTFFEPQESSLSTYDSRGEKLRLTPIKHAVYVVKGSVSGLSGLDLVHITVFNKQKKWTTEYDVKEFSKAPQSTLFEQQIDLFEGDNLVEIVAVNEKGNAVKETFVLPFMEDKEQAKGEDYLVLLAVDNYRSWDKLKNPVADAEGVQEVLVKNYSFKDSNIISLYNEKFNLKSVDSLFRKLILQIGENDRIIVYYAGHGFYDSLLQEGYWIPFDGESLTDDGNSFSGYIPNSRIDKYIKSLKSKHTLFITDACFSGSYFIDQGRGAYERKLGDLNSRWLFTSGRMEEVADSYANTGHSPFAYFLISFLADPPSDIFTISELVAAVSKSVGNNSKQMPVARPIKNSGDAGGEFVFQKKNDE